MSLESSQHFFEVGGIVLLFLTFVFGVGAWYTANELNKRQANEIRGLATQQVNAQTALASQQERAANAESELVRLRDTLERERAKTLQVQRSILQRIIPQTGHGDQRNYDVLKPFAGIKGVIVHSLQREPALFSGSVIAAVVNAGWIVDGGSSPATEAIPDGVGVGGHLGPNGETDRSMKAATVLAAFIQQYGIVGVHVFESSHIAPNTVLVRIGQMPDPSRALQ